MSSILHLYSKVARIVRNRGIVNYTIENLNDLVESIEGTDVDSDDYTVSSWQLFSDTFTAAGVVLSAEEPTQEEINTAYNNLNNAWNNKELRADKTALGALITTVTEEVGDVADYTANSWASFNNVLTSAQEMMNDTDLGVSNQSTVDEMVVFLTNAFDGLISLELLKSLMDDIDNEIGDEADYTPASWADYIAARSGANMVLNDPGSSAQDISDAYDALEAAYTALVEV